MTQGFRQMPRRMASRPGQLRNITQTVSETPEIQQVLRQIQTLAYQMQQLPSTSAALPTLHKRRAEFDERLYQLRSEARTRQLKTHTDVPPTSPQAARDFFHGLYTQKHPLPPALAAVYPEPAPEEMLAFHRSLSPLFERLMSPEQGACRSFWRPWLPEEKPEQKSETAATDFQVLTFERPTAAPSRPVSQVAAQSGLQVSFDVQGGRSTLRNAMGISLNQPKKSYQAYLSSGFRSIDLAVASGFKERYHLEHGILAFLEAVSLDKSRHEAYFGLGYLYALVQERNHAMYFLDLAYRISQDPAIAQLQAKVSQSLGISSPLSSSAAY